MSKSFAQSVAFYLKSPSSYINMERVVWFYIKQANQKYESRGKTGLPGLIPPCFPKTRSLVTEILLFEGGFEGCRGTAWCPRRMEDLPVGFFQSSAACVFNGLSMLGSVGEEGKNGQGGRRGWLEESCGSQVAREGLVSEVTS